MGSGKGEVRLRRAERLQVAMVVQCPDDLVNPTHPVGRVRAGLQPHPLRTGAARINRTKARTAAKRAYPHHT
jgi:hypothetical protein